MSIGHGDSGLELDDRRRKVGKATNPSLRTVQNQGLATSRHDLTYGREETPLQRFVKRLLKTALVVGVVGGAYFGYEWQQKKQAKADAAAAAQKDAEMRAALIPKNVPDCFVSNAGTYFTYKTKAGKRRKVRTIEQVPVQYRRKAKCVDVKKPKR